MTQPSLIDRMAQALHEARQAMGFHGMRDFAAFGSVTRAIADYDASQSADLGDVGKAGASVPTETPSVEEMRLCESARLIFRPNTLYRFTVAPGCKDCEAIVSLYELAEKVTAAPPSPQREEDHSIPLHQKDGQEDAVLVPREIADGAADMLRSFQSTFGSHRPDRDEEDERTAWDEIDRLCDGLAARQQPVAATEE